MAEISAAEVIAWLRRHAQTMVDAADDLEKALIRTELPKQQVPQVGDNNRSVSIFDCMKMELRQSARRAPELAERLGVPQQAIDTNIERHPETFLRGERGWLSLKGDQA